MGNRTRKINLINDKKNQIVRAYYELSKNNSSYFDNLITSYGSNNISKILAYFGMNEYNIPANYDEKFVSSKIAYEMVNKLYGKNYIPMELNSINYIQKDDKYRQQKYICFANKNRIDRKRKFDFDTLMKNIEKKDIVLVDVKEKELSAENLEFYSKIDRNEYVEQVFSLILKLMPTVSTICKKQNAIIMQEARKNNLQVYNEAIKLDKEILKTLFLYETSKEQLLLNDAVEEFQSKVWKMPVNDIKNNFNQIQSFKTKLDNIGQIMENNNNILKVFNERNLKNRAHVQDVSKNM